MAMYSHMRRMKKKNLSFNSDLHEKIENSYNDDLDCVFDQAYQKH